MTLSWRTATWTGKPAVTDEKDRLVALYQGGSETGRLIAAAPELHDMLRRLLNASPVMERDALYAEAKALWLSVEGRS